VIAAAAEREAAARAALDAVLAVRDWGAETDVGALQSAVRVLLGEVTGERGGGAPAADAGGDAAMAVDGVGVANGTGRVAANGHASSGAGGAAAAGSDIGSGGGAAAGGDGGDSDEDEAMGLSSSAPAGGAAPGTSPAAFATRAQYIPMRLTADERALLRLVEAALSVSEYTSEVDILSHNKAAARKRMHTQLRVLCAILTGLTVAADYKAGAALLESRDFAGNEAWFRNVFEIARRHKIANPHCMMKVEYGKLMYLLMDAVSPPIARLLEMDVVAPIQTVASFLAARGGEELLADPLLATATAEVVATGKSRPAIQREIRAKEAAVERLARRFATRTLPDEEVRRALYSIGDNNAYLRCSRDACDTMLGLLRHYFGGTEPAAKNELAILAGRGGARLSHGHARQFAFVEQSLTLWREITHNSTFGVVVGGGGQGGGPLKVAVWGRARHLPTRCVALARVPLQCRPCVVCCPVLWFRFVSMPALTLDGHLPLMLLSPPCSISPLCPTRPVLHSALLLCPTVFGLWVMADGDLLDSTTGYALRNTGQGLHRVQPASRVERAMARILRTVQERCAGWVGSSVVHIADANVPNAYTFLIKYTHIQDLLTPIINVVTGLDALVKKNARIGALVTDTWGGVEGARRAILRDFFRHAFDGSGADNFFSAGSCIDGRMTSAWNWCALIESKSYYPLFLLSGFTSFDGKW